MNRIVALSGAGISAESGLQTFRGAGGLWDGRRVEDVATPAAWAANPGLVLEFHNQRRRAVRAAEPNAAHRELVDLERAYDVRIVTQNVDDLHERRATRGGSWSIQMRRQRPRGPTSRSSLSLRRSVCRRS